MENDAQGKEHGSWWGGQECLKEKVHLVEVESTFGRTRSLEVCIGL